MPSPGVDHDEYQYISRNHLTTIAGQQICVNSTYGLQLPAGGGAKGASIDRDCAAAWTYNDPNCNPGIDNYRRAKDVARKRRRRHSDDSGEPGSDGGRESKSRCRVWF